MQVSWWVPPLAASTAGGFVRPSVRPSIPAGEAAVTSNLRLPVGPETDTSDPNRHLFTAGPNFHLQLLEIKHR